MWRSTPVSVRAVASRPVCWTGIVCAPSGEVYVVGQQGTILRGRRNQWSMVPTGLTVDLWDVCVFRNEVHACSMTQLFVIRGDQARPLALDPVRPGTFAELDSTA
jgi:hypothetical protein